MLLRESGMLIDLGYDAYVENVFRHAAVSIGCLFMLSSNMPSFEQILLLLDSRETYPRTHCNKQSI